MSELLNQSSEPRPTRLAIPLDSEKDHALGKADANVTLLEYGDYECPDCGRAYPMLGELRKRFGDELRFVFRHFPLFNVHSHASAAAQAAEAAGEQGKFWEMHDMLYRNQSHLESMDFTHYALRIGLDPYRFESAISNSRHARHVEDDFAGGQRSGVRGTPTLFINGTRYEGPIEVGAISTAIAAAGK